MTTLTHTAPDRSARDTSADIPMSRLVRVELRKLVDTRAGFWLVASMALISVVIAVSMLVANADKPQNLNFGDFFGLMSVPTGVFLPILAILLVTSEWSQRTALTTFTMEPRRERIIAAKLGAALVAAVAAVAVSLILGAIANVVAGIAYADPAGAWDFTAAFLVNSFVLQLLGLLMGFAFAALLLNTPGAIIAYFALPTAMNVLSELVPSFGNKVGDWVDPSRAQTPLMSGDWASGAQWAHLAVNALIWVVVPLVLGILRILRSEVK